MAYANFSQCSGCGKRIIWIRTPAGKNMPCNSALLRYKLDPSGKEKIVTPSGSVVVGRTDIGEAEADGVGYISHFATCTARARFRRNNA